MARTSASVAASRIRIEDEVWDEAFSSRVPSRRGRVSRPAGPARVVGDTRPYAAPSSVAAVEAPVARLDLPEPRRGVVEAPVARLDLPEPRRGVVEAPVARLDLPEPRRTVRIQGRGADPFRRDLVVHSRSAHRAPPVLRVVGTSPDRLAMWATLLGFMLVLVAILSSHF